MNDVAFIRHALNLARRNLGQTWPNPAVGAVVVKDGTVVGTGWTARQGRPHAEPVALAEAGEKARGATLYVTLEPCAHQGQTPPCTDAIIAAGITRCVVACADPHADVNGKGIAALKKKGIEVKTGIEEHEARAINAGFFSVVGRGRPWVTLKIATSSDNFMTAKNTPHSSIRLRQGFDGQGVSGLSSVASAKEDSANNIRWVTGEKSREFGHYLRSTHDAIVTGIGTVLADDPLLTCRLPGLENRSPVRVVLDRKGRLPAGCKLKQSEKDAPLWVERDTDDLSAFLAHLAQKGITRLLVEAGPTLSTAFLTDNLVDEMYWFRSAAPLGKEGSHAIDPLVHAPLTRRESRALGNDILEIYACSLA